MHLTRLSLLGPPWQASFYCIQEYPQLLSQLTGSAYELYIIYITLWEADMVFSLSVFPCFGASSIALRVESINVLLNRYLKIKGMDAFYTHTPVLRTQRYLDDYILLLGA